MSAKTAKPEPATTEPKPAAPTPADETVVGGRYLVNGELVDANGMPIETKR